MASKANEQAATFDEICFAAFSTHFRTVFSEKIKAAGHDPDAAAEQHWNANLPHVAALWRGLILAAVNNVMDAQKAGKLPPLALHGQPAATALPGLGGLPIVDTSPAALARRLAGEIRDRETQRQADSPLPADTPPGLAVGRATGDECTGLPSCECPECD